MSLIKDTSNNRLIYTPTVIDTDGSHIEQYSMHYTAKHDMIMLEDYINRKTMIIRISVLKEMVKWYNSESSITKERLI